VKTSEWKNRRQVPAELKNLKRRKKKGWKVSWHFALAIAGEEGAWRRKGEGKGRGDSALWDEGSNNRKKGGVKHRRTKQRNLQGESLHKKRGQKAPGKEASLRSEFVTE